MGVGQDVFNLAKEKGKSVAKQYAKKLSLMILKNPITWIIVGMFLLIIIIAGAISGDSLEVGGSTSGMVSVSGSGETYVINLYNDDGTVNEEKILELQVALEDAHNLVSADTDLNTAATDNIGGQYNKVNCEKVTGTYLGFSYWDGQIPRSKLGGIIYQCPWWANGRASQANGRTIQISGNAKDMYGNAQGTYKTGQTPKENSLVIYEGGDYGHVAYVEAVDYVNEYYYISHAGSGKSWFGIQKIKFGNAPWSGYTLKGFIYLDEQLQ